MKLPAWLTRDTLKLPSWARVVKSSTVDAGLASICIEGDTDGYVREWFELLGVKPADATQYWLEVAYQCAKLDLQLAIDGTQYDPRIAKKPAEFKFTRCNHWQLKLHPPGKGIELATKGHEARNHYRRIRGRIPL